LFIDMFSSVRPPYLVRRFYNEFTWSLQGAGRNVYLTFDDGPIPEVTEFVLDTLKEFGCKATFFCVGDNVRKHPELYSRILSEGHRTGNHTYSHKNGWLTKTVNYLEDVREAEKYIQSDLFRPPYGKIKRNQASALMPQYKIIMWDVLSYDFDSEVSAVQCLRNVTENTRPGSVIVFHDSVKAFGKVKQVLPEYLKFLKDNNFHPVTLS